LRTFLIILGIWLLLPRKHDAPRTSNAGYAPVTISKEAYPFNEEKKTSLSFIIVSVATGTFFVLAAPMAEAADAVERAFSKRPPAE
jgi:hypothetical protein